MDKKQIKSGRNRNKLTTNKQVVDEALTMWECNEYLTKSTLRNNLNSHFCDRKARLIQRLARESVNLGNDLLPPNPTAFETINTTKVIARQLGLID